MPTIEEKGTGSGECALSLLVYAVLLEHYVVKFISCRVTSFFFISAEDVWQKRVIITVHGIDWQREKWKSGFGWRRNLSDRVKSMQ